MLSLKLFGGVLIRVESGFPGGEAGQARRLALLALLTLSRTGAMTREKLIGYLWPEAGEERGRHLLSESLYVLRKSLGAAVLLSEGEVVRVNPDLVDCDVLDFEAALARGDLEHAVWLYGGPFLDGFFVRDAPEFERWVESERRRHADSYATALEKLAEAAEAAGDHRDTVASWKRLIAHDHYNSRYVLRLMQAMVAVGDPANAIKQAEEHARFLRDELGLEPPEELLALSECLIRQLSGNEVAQRKGANDRHVAVEPHQEVAPEEVARAADIPSQPARRFARRTAGLVVFAAMAVIGTVAVLWFALPWRGGRTIPEDVGGSPGNRIAVLPFTYHGGDEFAYLGEAMINLLSTTLDGVGDLQTVDPRAVLGTAGREATAFDHHRASSVAERLDAGWFVTGDVVEVEGQIRIDARLSRLRGRPADGVAATVEGAVGDFYELIDNLTAQLLLGAVGRVREYDHLAARTTHSLSALKAYLEGVSKLRAGHNKSAFGAFRRAVEIDSTFALAWFGMFGAGDWIGMMEWDQAMEAARKAVRHSGSLPLRAQKVLQGWAVGFLQGDGPEAERLSREALVDHPDDVQAWELLGTVLFDFNNYYGRPASESYEAYKRAYSYAPHDPFFREMAIVIAAKEGNWARYDSLTRLGGWEWSLGYEDDWSLNFRAVRAFGIGDKVAEERILDEARRAGNASPLAAGLTIVCWISEVPAAVELARLAVLDHLSEEARAFANVEIARLELGLGRWQAAQQRLDSVAELNRTWATLYRGLWAVSAFTPVTEPDLRAVRDSVANFGTDSVLPSVTRAGARAHDLLGRQLRLYVLGLLSQRLGDDVAALGYAAELEEEGNAPEALSYARDRAASIRGRVLFGQGRLEEALHAMEAQPRRIRISWPWEAPFYASPEDRFLRGEILLALERFDEALRWYETIGDGARIEPRHFAPALLRRAEIYERLGEFEKAALCYRAFVRFWRDCDPELRPIVEQAKLALERLTSEPQ